MITDDQFDTLLRIVEVHTSHVGEIYKRLDEQQKQIDLLLKIADRFLSLSSGPRSEDHNALREILRQKIY